jgi:hypothetical protein
MNSEAKDNSETMAEPQKKENSGKIDICLLGDIFRHIIVKPNPMPSDEDTEEPYKSYIAYAGVPLLRRMIVEAIKDEEFLTAEKHGNKVFPYYPEDDGDQSPMPAEDRQNMPKIQDSAKRLVRMLDYFPRSPEKPDDKVLRVKEKEKYLTSAEFYPKKLSQKDKDKDKENIKYQFERTNEHINNFDGKFKILVVYDRNLSFRKCVKENVKNEKQDLTNLLNATESGVVISIKENLDPKWLEFLGGIIQDADGKVKVKERCVVIITADALRKAGLNITLNGSLEQAVHEIVDSLHQFPLKAIIPIFCKHLVVLFRETLVVHITMPSKDDSERTGKGIVHFSLNFKRGIQADPSRYGEMPGKFMIMTTAIVKMLYDADEVDEVDEEELGKAVRLGIAGSQFLFNEGFCNPKSSGKKGDGKKDDIAPFDAFVESLGYARRKELLEKTSTEKEFKISSLEFSINKRSPKRYEAVNGYGKRWSRIDGLFIEKGINNVLYNIVENGIDKTINNFSNFEDEASKKGFPDPKIKCPYAEFGNLKTFDKNEAADFYALENILRKYLITPELKVPLSIAVFGYPGTGKNFTVKEIIKNVILDKGFQPLVFNLSQFNNIEQLTEAFHQVQDKGLLEELPLVIFDEFDANYEKEPLGWLKFFLAPMQDGEFLGKASTYHIHRAIFLFTGGTCHSFKKFEARKDAEKNAKLVDFISRLRGHLDVQSINVVEADKEVPRKPTDRDLLLRRAILLRSLLEKHAKPILKETKDDESSHTWLEAKIDREVITAFLYAHKYEHGARSMEAIIQMSRLIEGKFVSSSLPPRSQLESHVDIESFKEILPPSTRRSAS